MRIPEKHTCREMREPLWCDLGHSQVQYQRLRDLSDRSTGLQAALPEMLHAGQTQRPG